MNIAPAIASGTRGDARRIDIFLGGAPLLEIKVAEGLLDFGCSHPQWRFSVRGADFRYTRRWLREQAIDGVLVMIDARAVADTLNRAGVPWVHLFPSRAGRHPNVDVDNLAIGRLGADFFLGRGFLRCAFCGVGTPWSELRARGFRTRLAEANRRGEFTDIAFSPDEYWGLASGGESRLREWIAGLGRGVAVMAAHDAMANRIVDTCLQLGLRVPNDVAVLGVGNHELVCRVSPVPISSIDTGAPQAAFHAVTLLKAMIEGLPPTTVAPEAPTSVVERRSTELLVYGDDMVAQAITYIRDHATEGLKVSDLSRVYPVSGRTLARRFARYVGHSPGTEIRQARLRWAERLVRESGMSLTEVAMTCGYADLAHMDRAFRKSFKTAPGAIRTTSIPRVSPGI